MADRLTVGLDVGSTTVKAAVIDAEKRVLWKGYERHKTKQLPLVQEFLSQIQDSFGNAKTMIFTTGSGGKRIAGILGTRHFQEVNALSSAVEYNHGSIGSVFELGGQDAKYIAWRGDNGKFATMNDRCAGGTGATIDRILMKLNLTSESLKNIHFDSEKLYPIAGKCGVFAETDINSLQKQGVPVDSLIISLFQAVVEQNLSVLARGYIPYPPVLLLGGPNVFFKSLRETWKVRLHTIWDERNINYNDGDIYAPDNALIYGAIGAALLGQSKSQIGSPSSPWELLMHTYRSTGKVRQKKIPSTSLSPFFHSAEEKKHFYKKFAPKVHRSPTAGGQNRPYQGSSATDGLSFNKETGIFIGLDGGSTSTKGVILDKNDAVIETAYKISEGNPVEDARCILLSLHEKILQRGYRPRVRGIGFTGYAKDLLHAVFSGDVAIVETVAHTLGALKYFPDAEVICDVGGQDIKIILIRNGAIKDFRLNTQCSAGNGYYLQSTAERFGYSIDEYADAALSAKRVPDFNFGCAVFLEADIVNFQQLGWKPEEIMAGLARILPQNVWLYVVREPNLSRLGKEFVLQGGTHHNLAVVKSQYDFIKSKVKDACVHVHPYNEVAGAIGAALEAHHGSSAQIVGKSRNPRLHLSESKFVGFDTLPKIRYSVDKSEKTRCSYCKNRCMRTFISVEAGQQSSRYIIANCEKGQAQSRDALAQTIKKIEKNSSGAPHFVHITNKEFFKSISPPSVNNTPTMVRRKRDAGSAVIGIPRVLNMYSTAPFFRTYFKSLGVKNVVFSDFTSQKLYKKTAGRGSIDPCFPSKIAISHVYNLLNKAGVSHIFFPCIRMVKGEIHEAIYHWACPALAATPEVVKAAFTLEKDEFQERNIKFLNPVLDIAEWDVFNRQLHACSRTALHVSKKENQRAVEAALSEWETSINILRTKAEKKLHEIEIGGDIGIVLLGRPYHNDPGINHGILDELNRLGYPIFTIESLPRNGDIVNRLFEKDRRENTTNHLDVRDVWSRCYSENTSLKIWAAKFVSRHPNLIALDLSSFRCGHDAPLYSVLDEIFDRSSSPYFTFHEIDENKPVGSIRIRVETIHYFLKRYKEDLLQCQKFSLVV
jgi:predicted CoA-substrate-specific enzyme activase